MRYHCSISFQLLHYSSFTYQESRFIFFIDQTRLLLQHIHIIYLTNYSNIESTTDSNTEKITEAPSVIEHEELETLVSIEPLERQKTKCGIDEVLKLVRDSLEENISRESFDKT